MEKTVRGILLVAHGSEREDAEQDVRQMVTFLQEKADASEVCIGYLGFREPNLAEAVLGLWKKGVTELVVMPCFLTSGYLHNKAVQKTLEETASYEGLRVLLAEPLGGHPRLAEVLIDRILEAEKSANRTC